MSKRQQVRWNWNEWKEARMRGAERALQKLAPPLLSFRLDQATTFFFSLRPQQRSRALPLFSLFSPLSSLQTLGKQAGPVRLALRRLPSRPERPDPRAKENRAAAEAEGAPPLPLPLPPLLPRRRRRRSPRSTRTCSSRSATARPLRPLPRLRAAAAGAAGIRGRSRRSRARV